MENQTQHPTVTLLQDLARAGVTDVVTDTAYHWQAPLPRNPWQAPKPQEEKVETSATAQPHATPTPQPVIAPEPLIKKQEFAPTPEAQLSSVSHEKPVPEDWLWSLAKTDAKLVILTAAESMSDKQNPPFTSEGYTLLTNMLKAIDIDIQNVSFFCVAACDDIGKPISPEQSKALSGPAKAMLEDLKPACVLALGQVAANMLARAEHTLATARTQAQEGKLIFADVPTAITYHPRTLLKQPAMKRLAWQDLLIFKTKIEETAESHA